MTKFKVGDEVQFRREVDGRARVGVIFGATAPYTSVVIEPHDPRYKHEMVTVNVENVEMLVPNPAWPVEAR